MRVALNAFYGYRRRHGGKSSQAIIHFQFSNAMTHEARVLAVVDNRPFFVEYFGGSQATFELAPDGDGGTELTLTETGIPADWFHEHRAGWVSVLLTLKAAVDFSVDLRNPDPDKHWDTGYVDV